MVRREFEQSNVNTYMLLLLQPDHRLQGHVPGGAAAEVLPGPARSRIMRSRHRPGPLPVLHQHQPLAGSGPIPTATSLHNGEINTIRGNVDRMLAREETMHSGRTGGGHGQGPAGGQTQSGSDSAMLDNTLEFLMMNGIRPAPGGDGRASRSPGRTTGTCPGRSGTSTTTTPP